MANIQITFSGSGAQVVVDGVDITKSVLAEGFGIEFPGHHGHPGIVSMRVKADHLAVDLPDAIVKAERSRSDAFASAIARMEKTNGRLQTAMENLHKIVADGARQGRRP